MKIISQIKTELCQISDRNLVCDMSTGIPSPFVPNLYRKLTFSHLHNRSHPGIAAKSRMIYPRYVWPAMKREIKT
ncbi:reverse transcriptase [Caerostris extrusa]|uniref:Reverse transcriptase n=1 Tax=Caerostris extrusa TaxID=172846 RepID=A0AAV4QHG4_CAEEX|nr:reverse transcriptase [Caerostris extrusa]